jgi:hypothetical protein
MIRAHAVRLWIGEDAMRLRATLTDDEGEVRLPRRLAAAAALGGEVEIAVADGRLELRRPGWSDRAAWDDACAGMAEAGDDRCRWD